MSPIILRATFIFDICYKRSVVCNQRHCLQYESPPPAPFLVKFTKKQKERKKAGRLWLTSST